MLTVLRLQTGYETIKSTKAGRVGLQAYGKDTTSQDTEDQIQEV